jgi:hypothetical protein
VNDDLEKSKKMKGVRESEADTTCDRCNKSVEKCECFNQKTVKSSELQENKMEKKQASQEEGAEMKLAKVMGKINSIPQTGSDVSGNTYYLTNFTDQSSNTFPIYLWEKPVLSDKQKYRKQFWSGLIENFKQLTPETPITIEGYYWHRNNRSSFTLLGYHNEE